MKDFKLFITSLLIYEHSNNELFKRLGEFPEIHVYKYLRETSDQYYMKLVGIKRFTTGRTELTTYLSCAKGDRLWYTIGMTETNWNILRTGPKVVEYIKDPWTFI